MVRVKICGITNKEDAFLAVDLGADALGFIFAPSPRRITPQKAKDIIKALPPFIDKVGVFVNEEAQKVKDICKFCFLTSLQFHGDEPPLYCTQFKEKVIKSFSVKDKVPEGIEEYKVDAYLLDTFHEKKRGGTGKRFDWNIAARVKDTGVPLILSGGLTPENVGIAIRKVRPYAVDVSSGVEIKPGKKSKTKMKKFFQKVRENENLCTS